MEETFKKYNLSIIPKLNKNISYFQIAEFRASETRFEARATRCRTQRRRRTAQTSNKTRSKSFRFRFRRRPNRRDRPFHLPQNLSYRSSRKFSAEKFRPLTNVVSVTLCRFTPSFLTIFYSRFLPTFRRRSRMKRRQRKKIWPCRWLNYNKINYLKKLL